MPPPPLTPIRRGRRSDVEHSHTVTEPNQQTILIVQRTPAIHSASLSNVITMADQTQLPHKKRHTAVARSPETRSQLTTSAPVRSPAAPSPPPALAFQCQLCSLPCTSQLDFFRHLQSHYETAPAPTDADEGAPHAIKEEANEVLIDDPAADVVAVQQAKIEMDVEVVVARPKRERVRFSDMCWLDRFNRATVTFSFSCREQCTKPPRRRQRNHAHPPSSTYCRLPNLHTA